MYIDQGFFDKLQFESGYVPVKVALKIEDGEAISTMYRLRNRLGHENIKGIEKATIWKLYLKGNNHEKAAREIAEGLLTNPHKDSYEVLGKESLVSVAAK